MGWGAGEGGIGGWMGVLESRFGVSIPKLHSPQFKRVTVISRWLRESIEKGEMRRECGRWALRLAGARVPRCPQRGGSSGGRGAWQVRWGRALSAAEALRERGCPSPGCSLLSGARSVMREISTGSVARWREVCKRAGLWRFGDVAGDTEIRRRPSNYMGGGGA